MFYNYIFFIIVYYIDHFINVILTISYIICLWQQLKMKIISIIMLSIINNINYNYSFPVAQLVEHGASNAKIMGSIPRESKS